MCCGVFCLLRVLVRLWWKCSFLYFFGLVVLLIIVLWIGVVVCLVLVCMCWCVLYSLCCVWLCFF